MVTQTLTYSESTMDETLSAPAELEFVPIDLRVFAVETPPRVDLYLRLSAIDRQALAAQLRAGVRVVIHESTAYVLYCESESPLSAESRSRLLDRGITKLYVHLRDGQISAGGRTLASILAEPPTSVPSGVKLALLQNGIQSSARRVLTAPGMCDLLTMTCQAVQGVARTVVDTPELLAATSEAVSRDPNHFSHSTRVCVLSSCIGRLVGLKAHEISDLTLGAFLHDIGMAKVPASIIEKPGKLTSAERRAMQKHPLWGSDALPSDMRRRPGVYMPVLQHHERLDGSGYPSGLRGTQVDYFARIVGLADKYEALTSDRPHRPARAPFQAMRVIREEMADQFERDLFIPLLQMLGAVD
jgi:HD-GYP domain-containing protein (c-di-GMP phosphodiesterase class II)